MLQTAACSPFAKMVLRAEPSLLTTKWVGRKTALAVWRSGCARHLRKWTEPSRHTTPRCSTCTDDGASLVAPKAAPHQLLSSLPPGGLPSPLGSNDTDRSTAL